MTDAIKWTDIITAVSTAVLAFGVIFAAAQYYLTRKAARLEATQHLIDKLNTSALPAINNRLERFDGLSTYLETSRTRATAVYLRLERVRHRKAYRNVWNHINSAIQNIADLADRIEIYIRKGNADEGTIAEHAGYCIVSSYYILQDVLRRRTFEDDYSYEGFRDLSCRIQDYSKLYPLEVEMRPQLTWAHFSKHLYSDGVESESYLPKWAVIRRIRLTYATICYQLSAVGLKGGVIMHLWRLLKQRISDTWRIGSTPLRPIVAVTTVAALVLVLITMDNGLIFRGANPLYLLSLGVATFVQALLYCLSFCLKDEAAVRVLNVGTFGIAAVVTMLWLSSSDPLYAKWLSGGAVLTGVITMVTIILITAAFGQRSATT